jgi:hypothetical protein
MGHMSTATAEEITSKRKAAAAKAWETMRANRATQEASQPALRELHIKLVTDSHAGRYVCENCGLPDGCRSTAGCHVQITRKAENRFKRDTKATVWVCSRECGVQIVGVSTYGKQTSRWPMSLDQLRATVRAAFAQKAVN